MKILCGQCGQMSLTDETSDPETVSCTHCGHGVGTNGSAKRPVFDVDGEDQAFAVLMRTALARKIHINCGSCGRGLKVSLRMAGRQTTCPACAERIRLPLAGQEAERRIEELIAKRSPQVLASDTVVLGKGDSSRMHFDESELAELATYVETDGSDDDLTLDILDDDDLMHRTADAMEGREILALSAAVSAAEPPGKPSAAEELPALQQAVKERPREIRTGMSGQKKAVMMTVAAALVIGVGLWLATQFLGGPQTDPTSGDLGLNLNPDTGNKKSPGNGGNTKPPVDPPMHVIPIPPKPIKILAASRAMTSSTDSFAGGGFFPAEPGQVFCRICVEVKAGDDKLELDNYGAAATLTIGLNKYSSLGEPVLKSLLPTLPRKKRLTIQPGKTREITMLFQLPQKTLGTAGATGIVALGSTPQVKVKLGSPAHVLPAKAVTDSLKPYMEIAPRNTRPLLSDPVMSAIQNTIPQKLSIRPGAEADSVKLTLGSGEVTGTARQDARGLYVTTLTHNGSTLQCLLRFGHGGREAILYLSDQPFHQLTFAQPGWSKTVPVIPQQPKIVKPVPKDPTDPPKPKPRPNNGGRGGGFFGV